ncbi:trypsin-like peptidase domain-containing protein [Dactylosporangium cerinum]|uniref:Trypsin-like peptidase domain-containing protein n=1 Tax=Dactylosporangium cerinum TaxID=1434730 RepID=A0ABV9W9S7_9ACTN
MSLADRLVEVIVDAGEGVNPRYRYGSGCIVAGRTVLTAAHVVAGDVAVRVRTPKKELCDASIDLRFVGQESGPAPDLALVEIDDPSVDFPALRLARLDRDSAVEAAIRCHAFGYPWFTERPSPAAVREIADAIGEVPVLSKLATGLASVLVRDSPRPLPLEDCTLAESPWSGMSGGPVIAGGKLLGVVIEHAPREGQSTITMAPISLLEHDPDYPLWGPGVSDPGAWWSRLGVTGIADVVVLPPRSPDVAVVPEVELPPDTMEHFRPKFESAGFAPPARETAGAQSVSHRMRSMLAAAAGLLTALLTLLLWTTAGSAHISAIWGVLGGVMPFVIALATWVLTKPALVVADDVALIRYMSTTLAEQERSQGVHDPWPMPVVLRVAAHQSMDRWDVIRGEPDVRTPIELDGDVRAIEKVFAAIPSGRIVLVGPGGAGKTTAARRLAAACALSWSPGAPIPVIVPLALWDVHTVDLSDWLVSWMSENLGPLVNRPQAARQLLDTGQLMLIMDGFDEIPASVRPSALIAVNRLLRPGQRIVLTSRPSEYAAATARGEVLRAAPVLELAPLTPAAIWDYLAAAASQTAAAAWRDLHRRVDDRHPLLRTLAVPLFLSMARELYGSGDRDPLDLLDPRRYAGRAAIETALLAAYVEYALGERLRPVRRGATTRRVREAERTLRFLARATIDSNDPTIASWRLHNFAPRLAVGGLFGAVVGVTAAFGLTLSFIVYRPQNAASAADLAFMLSALLVGGVAAALAAPQPKPVFTQAAWLTAARGRSPWLTVFGVMALVLVLRSVTPHGIFDQVLAIAATSCVVPWAMLPSRRQRRVADAVDRYHRAVVAGVVFAVAATMALLQRSAQPEIPVSAALILAGALCGYLNHDRQARVPTPARPLRSVRSRVAVTIVVTMVGLVVAYRPQTAAFVVKEVLGGALDLVSLGLPASAGLNDTKLFGVVVAAVVALLSAQVGGGLAAARTDGRQPRRIAPRLRDLPEVASGRIARGAAVGAVLGFSSDLLTGFGDFVSSLLAGGVTLSPPASPMAVELRLTGADQVFSALGGSDVIGSAFLGAVIGLLLALLRWVQTPVDTADAVDHRSVLRADRRVFVLAAAVPAVLSVSAGNAVVGHPVPIGADAWLGVADWSAMALPRFAPYATHLAGSPVAGGTLGVILVSSFVMSFVGVPLLLYATRDIAWQQYRCAHVWLVLSGRVPVRLARFLAHAQTAGILREVGGAYQFRHERLAKHLSGRR